MLRPFALFALLLSGSAMAAPYASITLSPVAAKTDIALMRRGLETIHPGLYRYRSKREIDAAFSRLEAVAATPVTDIALHKAMALMLAEIRCDHSKAEQSDAINDYRRDNPTHLPFRFVIVEGRMIVASNDGQTGVPPRGAEVLTINGKPVATLLTTLGKAVAYDGTTDQAIAVKLANDSDLSGDDFNEYYPAFFGFPSDWVVEWKHPGASVSTRATLRAITFPRWTELKSPYGPQRDEFYKSVGFRMAGKSAVLRIDTFVNYRNPVDTDLFLGSFFKSMKAQGTDHLILDLRNNGGGSGDVSITLGKYLFAKPFIWSKPALLKAIRYGDLSKYIDTWGDRDALFNPPESGFSREGDWWVRTPVADDDSRAAIAPVITDHFDGKLTILTGPVNASGATMTVAQFKENRGAELIGEATSGSAEGPTAGQMFLMILPNSKLKFRIPLQWNRTNIKNWVPSRGVEPDRLVTAALADFVDGRDRVLDTVRKPVDPIAPEAWPAALVAALTGAWSGVLEYRDYGNDARVVLPTRLVTTPDGSAAMMSWTYDDGPGKTVRSTEAWTIEPVTRTLVMGESTKTKHAITEFASDPATGELTVVADGSGVENGTKVMIRTMITRRGTAIRMSRMSRKTGEPFILRQAYELSPSSR